MWIVSFLSTLQYNTDKMARYQDATLNEIDESLIRSWQAFQEYRKLDLKDRALFLRTIAEEMDQEREALISVAADETHLDDNRLKVEFKRTIYQLTSYASACEE